MAINKTIKKTRWHVYLLEDILREDNAPHIEPELKYVFNTSFDSFVTAVHHTNRLSSQGKNVRLMTAPLAGPTFTEPAIKNQLNAQLEIYDEQLYILNIMRDTFDANN